MCKHFMISAIMYTAVTAVFVFVVNYTFAQTLSNSDSSKTKQPKVICTFNIDSNLNKLYPPLGVPHHRKIPVDALQDSDGDGIPDQLDLEPNTPHGTEVDAHGRALDTDGDGVPDYRDKEKLTLQSCFPVDINGVGVSSEPECCWELRHIDRRMWANSGSADSILYSRPLFPCQKFETINLTLSKEEIALLDSTVNRILANRNRDIRIKYRALVDYLIVERQKEKIEFLRRYIIDKTGISEHIITIDDHPDGTFTDNIVEIISSPWMAFD